MSLINVSQHHTMTEILLTEMFNLKSLVTVNWIKNDMVFHCLVNDGTLTRDIPMIRFHDS